MKPSKAQRRREEAARQTGFFAPEPPPKKTNPCLRLFGEGPEGRKCKECVFLIGYHQSARWYKCRLRAPGGPATDHRINWPACAKFEDQP